MVNIEQVQERLTELINDLEVIHILHTRVLDDIQDATLKIEDLQQDVENLINAGPVVEIEADLDTYRRSIGREARITNPGPGELSIGTVRHVDNYYVHLDLPDGSSRRRSTANLRLRSHE